MAVSIDPNPPAALLGDGVLALRLRGLLPAEPARGRVPSYAFDITLAATGEAVGSISLRVGDAPSLWLGGHIGYNVQPRHRGNRYARRACALVLPLARHCGMATVRITCNPDNLPSRRTIEGLPGARLVAIVPVPRYSELWLRGDREKCIFEIPL